MRRDAPQHLLDRFTEMPPPTIRRPTSRKRSRSTKRVRSSPKPVSRKSRRSIARAQARRARLRDPAEETGAGLSDDRPRLPRRARRRAARRRRRALLGGRARRDAAAVRDAAQRRTRDLAGDVRRGTARGSTRSTRCSTRAARCQARLRGARTPPRSASSARCIRRTRTATRPRAAARKQIDGQVYEVDPHAAAVQDRAAPGNGLHARVPRLVAFYCRQPADAGGETPICDMRRVTARAALRERFAERGVMYLRISQRPARARGRPRRPSGHAVRRIPPAVGRRVRHDRARRGRAAVRGAAAPPLARRRAA